MMKKYSFGAGWTRPAGERPHVCVAVTEGSGNPAVRIAGILPGLLMVALTTAAFAQETVKVTGDRVSLRAAPKLTAVLLTRTALNDQLVLADNSNPDWVGVRPPENIDLWVSRDYVNNGVVQPAKLNIRSGPSLSHEVVGAVGRGEKLTVRGRLDGWLKIAPPAGVVAWISRKYTDLSVADVKAPVDEPVRITQQPDVPEIPKESAIQITVESPKSVPARIIEPEPVVEKVVQPVINEILVAASALPDLPEMLMPDPDKEQGVPEQFSGILQPANNILFKLVDPTFESIVVCYIRGNQKQMKSLAGCPVVLSGKAYWAAGLEPPFLVPETIELLPR